MELKTFSFYCPENGEEITFEAFDRCHAFEMLTSSLGYSEVV